MAAPIAFLQPSDWPAPSGYSHGIAGIGLIGFVSGQIGADHSGLITSVDLVEQAERALQKIVAILDVVGAAPHHVAEMAWFVTKMDEYRARQADLDVAYRRVMGRHYPAMTLLGVNALAHPAAVVEISATALLPISGA